MTLERSCFTLAFISTNPFPIMIVSIYLVIYQDILKCPQKREFSLMDNFPKCMMMFAMVLMMRMRMSMIDIKRAFVPELEEEGVWELIMMTRMIARVMFAMMIIRMMMMSII